jgi:hypothetical protein
LLARNTTKPELHDVVGLVRDRLVMCGTDDRGSATHLAEQCVKNRSSVLGVEVPSGLIRQEHLRMIRQGPSQCNALLLAPRELPGPVAPT